MAVVIIVMVLQILRIRAAAVVTFDPGFGAIGVDLLLPNREPVFDVVDDVARGEKGVATVVCGDADPDGDVACGEWTEAMHDRSVFNVEFGLSLFDDHFRDRRCELGVARIVLVL